MSEFTIAPHLPAPRSFLTRLAGVIRDPRKGWEAVQRRVAKVVHPPTVLHVTHYKAGSQWILQTLKGPAPPRFVSPELGSTHFLGKPVLPGKLYPTLYVTKEEFDSVELPKRWRRFVVIRDLRDTLIS